MKLSFQNILRITYLILLPIYCLVIIVFLTSYAYQPDEPIHLVISTVTFILILTTIYFFKVASSTNPKTIIIAYLTSMSVFGVITFGALFIFISIASQDCYGENCWGTAFSGFLYTAAYLILFSIPLINNLISFIFFYNQKNKIKDKR